MTTKRKRSAAIGKVMKSLDPMLQRKQMPREVVLRHMEWLYELAKLDTIEENINAS